MSSWARSFVYGMVLDLEWELKGERCMNRPPSYIFHGKSIGGLWFAYLTQGDATVDSERHARDEI
jgi:hypothetical protein